MLSSLCGGLLIGLAAALLLIGHGRISGISGVVGGALTPRAGDLDWRLLFLGGLIGGGVLFARVAPAAFPAHVDGSVLRYVVAGVLVGFGTRLGNGCTSGHGVCGISRGSLRSIAATATFMAAGFAVVFVVRHVLGG